MVHYERVIDLSGNSTPVPNICQYCGLKFPWAKKSKSPKKAFFELKTGSSFLRLRKIAKVTFAILSFLSLCLAIITDGFQAWDIFKSEKELITTQPLLNISLSPIRVNYSTLVNSTDHFYINGLIETGNGIYKFIDSTEIDSFQIIDSSFFYWELGPPGVEIIETQFDKMILEENIKEQNIRLKLKRNYILMGDKVIDLYNSKKDKLIANVFLSFPYYFAGAAYKYHASIPIFTYYK